MGEWCSPAVVVLYVHSQSTTVLYVVEWTTATVRQTSSFTADDSIPWGGAAELRAEGWGLYHCADCIQRGIKPHSLCFCGLHVRVVHGVFKGRLSICVFVTCVAIVLHFWSCSGGKKEGIGQHYMLVCHSYFNVPFMIFKSYNLGFKLCHCINTWYTRPTFSKHITYNTY